MADNDDELTGEAAVEAALERGIEEGSKVVPIERGRRKAEKAAPADKPVAKTGGRGGKPKVSGPMRVDDQGRMILSEPPKIKQLPPDAPVRALGTSDRMVYFLDAHSQLRELAAKDLSRSIILHLFGTATNWLYELWPTLRANASEGIWVITGWDGTKAQEALMAACAHRGVWKPQDHVQGRGAWRLPDGRLAIHSGNRLHMSDQSVSRPGLVGNMVFPAGPTTMEPTGPGDLNVGKAEAAEVLMMLETWSWHREYDARLLLGWIVASMMGGALKIRPLVWVTGDKGAGKSTLLGKDGLIELLLDGWLITTANTTAAGLYQKIGYDSLPVAVDEIEAKRGNEKTEAVIELARQAYSGGMVLRGGQNHEGKEFQARCSVIFGSILIPPLMPQDVSRLALLNLRPLSLDQPEPVLDQVKLRNMGRAIMRRVLNLWPHWETRFAAWHGYLRGMGHSGRAADQFGTLLAAADLALSDGIPDEDCMRIVAGGMQPMNLRETADEASNASRCVAHAMSRPIPGPRGGEYMLVAELITCAVRRYGGEMENPIKPLDALRYLERAGVSVLLARREKPQSPLQLVKTAKANPAELSRMLDGDVRAGDEGVYIAFSPDGDGILSLFKGSDWEGVAGAHNPYLQALERVFGAMRSPVAQRIGGRTSRAILIPISECIDVPTKEEAAANDAG